MSGFLTSCKSLSVTDNYPDILKSIRILPPVFFFACLFCFVLFLCVFILVVYLTAWISFNNLIEFMFFSDYHIDGCFHLLYKLNCFSTSRHWNHQWYHLTGEVWNDQLTSIWQWYVRKLKNIWRLEYAVCILVAFYLCLPPCWLFTSQYYLTFYFTYSLNIFQMYSIRVILWSKVMLYIIELCRDQVGKVRKVQILEVWRFRIFHSNLGSLKFVTFLFFINRSNLYIDPTCILPIFVTLSLVPSSNQKCPCSQTI